MKRKQQIRNAKGDNLKRKEKGDNNVRKKTKQITLQPSNKPLRAASMNIKI